MTCLYNSPICGQKWLWKSEPHLCASRLESQREMWHDREWHHENLALFSYQRPTIPELMSCPSPRKAWFLSGENGSIASQKHISRWIFSHLVHLLIASFILYGETNHLTLCLSVVKSLQYNKVPEFTLCLVQSYKLSDHVRERSWLGG